MTKPAKLILASGETFSGDIPVWQPNVIVGEAVFNTSMVGYVEAATDPSYSGQLLTFTYPLIGNYGVPAPARWESERAQAAALVLSSAADFYQHRDGVSALLTWCHEQQLPLIMNIDTRALTKSLSRNGATAAAIVADGSKMPATLPDINKEHWVKKVSIAEPQQYDNGERTLVVVDCGMKRNIWRHLQRLPLNLKRVPFDYDFTNEPYDAVFISNGPGNPEICRETIVILQKVLAGDKPVFGVCLGSQLMALAIGAKTYKLRFGHRGQNQPCLLEGSERCYLTSQNHGYSIVEESLPEEWQVLFRHLNDETVQGICHRNKPFSSVQFHPEAAPGPTDTEWLFDQFYQTIVDHYDKAKH
ncbi:MAG: glutamine-hydrolyzing carbamoyl-phosphate synthase small subunit [Gammaproteobacteria bacterium]|nr:glutamine-hydrolyzing carbamoyl-phosphate synthase small subunit [Gammaproteobacteria bacterium]